MPYFPLFTDATKLRGLIVGGGEVAFRKLKVLQQFDVRCDLVAPEVIPEIVNLADLDQLNISSREFEESDLTHCNFVVVATNDQALNRRISGLCHARSVWVNVVDNAELSSFIFPAIVERKPLTLAFSSGGASPTFVRRLRTRFESLIPNSTGSVLEYLATKRAQAKSRKLALTSRLWDDVLDSAIPDLIAKHRVEEADQIFEALATGDRPPGYVSLVGAGPGDPDLLTTKALDVMQRADVVYYDNLVSEPILDLVRREAKRVYVGKKRAYKSIRQEEISALLLADALAGHRVLRLKGGDPMLFGRGGEETAALLKHGVRFEVIPGITAALGCAAYAGIPLTHRDHAQSVRFVTGHLQDGQLNLDWPELAKVNQTLVVYMGLVGLEELTRNLIAAGLAKTTQVAVISRGTLPDQQIIRSTIDTIARLVRQVNLPGPTTTIIGNVVSLAEHLPLSMN